jgi:hypothetical protein
LIDPQAIFERVPQQCQHGVPQPAILPRPDSSTARVTDKPITESLNSIREHRLNGGPSSDRLAPDESWPKGGQVSSLEFDSGQ